MPFLGSFSFTGVWMITPSAEMIITSKFGHFTATAVTSDLYGSLLLVMEKMERQLRREKRRRTDRRRRAGVLARTRPPGRRPARSGPRRPRPVHLYPEPQAAKPMSVEEAVLDLNRLERDFLVFRNAQSERMSVVYRRRDGEIGLIEGN